MVGADFLVALSQLKEGLGPSFHEQCIKLEKEVAFCFKSLQAKTVVNKYACMDVKRINCEVHWKWENYSSTSAVAGCVSHSLLICFSLFPVGLQAAFIDLYEIYVSSPSFPVFWEFYS